MVLPRGTHGRTWGSHKAVVNTASVDIKHYDLAGIVDSDRLCSLRAERVAQVNEVAGMPYEALIWSRGGGVLSHDIVRVIDADSIRGRRPRNSYRCDVAA